MRRRRTAADLAGRVVRRCVRLSAGDARGGDGRQLYDGDGRRVADAGRDPAIPARGARDRVMKRTHLPLNALRVLDAAARHLSFTRAADELAVTPAAVGQQIRALEDMLRSEEHTSELQSLMRISYAVFCLKKKNTKQND